MKYTLVYWDPPSRSRRAAKRTYKALASGERVDALRDLPVAAILAELRGRLTEEWTQSSDRAWTHSHGPTLEISGTSQFVRVETGAMGMGDAVQFFDELLRGFGCNRQVFEERHEITEDLLSAIALGKTVAFLFYSLFAFFVAVAFAILAIGAWYPAADTGTSTLIAFGLLETILLVLVVKGWLPATSGQSASPFSEKHAAWGLATLSFAPWLFDYDPTWFVAFNWLINGTLFLTASVFFVTKSVLSKKIRLEVLGVLVVPVVQLVIGELSHGA